MSRRKKVVAFGFNVSLMDTRLRLLEESRFESRRVFYIADLIRALSVDAIDLILLCNSLSNADKHSALSIVAQVTPNTPTLRLTVSDLAEAIGGETILNVADGPHKLLEVAETLTSCVRT